MSIPNTGAGFTAPQATQEVQVLDPNGIINWAEFEPSTGGMYLDKLGKYIATIEEVEVKQGSKGYYFIMKLGTAYGSINELINSSMRTLKFIQHLAVCATGQPLGGQGSITQMLQGLIGQKLGITVIAAEKTTDAGVPYLNISKFDSLNGFIEEVGATPVAGNVAAAPVAPIAPITPVGAAPISVVQAVPPLPVVGTPVVPLPVAPGVAAPVAPVAPIAPVTPPVAPVAPVGTTAPGVVDMTNMLHIK